MKIKEKNNFHLKHIYFVNRRDKLKYVSIHSSLGFIGRLTRSRPRALTRRGAPQEVKKRNLYYIKWVFKTEMQKKNGHQKFL